jgi:hypothetical protein
MVRLLLLPLFGLGFFDTLRKNLVLDLRVDPQLAVGSVELYVSSSLQYIRCSLLVALRFRVGRQAEKAGA